MCDKNEQLHVFDSEETLEDAEKSQLKMNEFQKDEKVQELKIQPIDYGKLNKLYDNFVPQKELPAEQTYVSSSSISSEESSSKTKPSMASTPSANPMLVDLNEMENIFQTLFKLIQKICKRDEKEMNPIVQIVSKDVSNESKTADTVCNDAFEVTQGLSKRIVELEKDVSKFEAKSIAFEIALQHKSRENNSLKTLQKENENFMASLQLENAHLKQTYKDLFESVQRSKVEINQCDEVKVKDNFDEIETKNIELEHRFNDILEKIEFFKKNHFDSFVSSNVDCNISELKKAPEEKQNLFENKTSVFQIKIDELEKVLTQQTKDFNAVKLELSNRTAKFEAYFEKLEKMKVVLERQLARKVDDSKAEKDQFLKEINHLRTQLENLKGKSVKTKFDKHSILGKPPADKFLINSQISKSWFTPKVDMQKSLSKPVTAQSLPKNEKDQLFKRIAYLESKLASQDIRSCQKEYHELRTSYNALKVKFDSLNRKKWNINVSKSSKPRESVSAKVHTGESSKPFSKRVSQFTTYSLQKDRKFSKKSQYYETFFPQKGFKTRASNAKNQSFETSHFCFTPVKQVWRPIKESQTFEASTSQKSFKTSTLKGNNQVFVTPHSRFTPVKQVWRPKQSHLKSFKYSKSEMLSMQNKNDLALKNKNNGRFSNASKTNFQNDTSNGNNQWKFSSTTRFKTLTLKHRVMAAPIITISSEESVGSHAPRLILFGAIPAIIHVIPQVSIVPADPIVAPKVGTILVVSPTGADSEFEPAEQRPISSSHDTLAPLSEFPLAPVVAPPRIRRRPAILVRPGSSSERSLNSSSPSSRPSRKRCRSSTASVPSPTHVSRLITPTPTDLLPHRKRFRDLYSPKDSEEEHMEVDTADTEAVADVGISEGVVAHPEDGVGMGFKIAASDVREDDEEFEAEASVADTKEIVVIHWLLVIVLSLLEERQLEASQLVASGERASLVERIRSLRLEYLKVRRDRHDTRRRLRRLESYVERHLGFRP
ncbi:hypothetical protein Tco_0475608 [Tanacetum coccineum]